MNPVADPRSPTPSRNSFSFKPRLIASLSGYTRHDLRADVTAGITVGILALPLAMAFAIASGVRPEAGLFTAIIAGFLVSALGGSRVQIGGPTGAFVVLVYGIVSAYGAHNLIVCTMMAGVILIVMGLARMGNIIKFIPYPVTTGFTAGIAVLILSTQLKDFFGLPIEAMPADFVHRMQEVSFHLLQADPLTLLAGAGSLAVIVAWPPRLGRFVPGSIVAMALATTAVALLALPVETIGTKFGGIPSALPSFELPSLHWSHIRELFSPALTIALLAAIESLLSAVVADGMIEERHDSNQELLAQGVANVVAPLFGGIPATGAIARTATNVRSGARTPVAGMVHAVTSLGIVLVAAPVAYYIPLATLAAVLVMIAWKMGEWHVLRRIALLPKSDGAVLLTVFALTVLVDLTVAVEFGMVLAAILYIKKVTDSTVVSPVDAETETEGLHHSLTGKEVPPGVLVYRVFGAFLFGATEKLEEGLRISGSEPQVLILRLRKIIAIDATGLNALERMLEHLRARGHDLVLSGPQFHTLRVMARAGFIEKVGRENVCPNIDAALARAREIIAAREAARAVKREAAATLR
jgi:SulP family sulfate permease